MGSQNLCYTGAMETILLVLLLLSVVIIHALIMITIVLGALGAISGYLIKLKRHHQITYLSVIAGVIVSFALTGACIFTTLEHWLRRTYFPVTYYSEGFVSHYLSYLGWHVSDQGVFWFLVITITTGILGTLFHGIRHTVRQRRLR